MMGLVWLERLDAAYNYYWMTKVVAFLNGGAIYCRTRFVLWAHLRQIPT